MKYLSGNSLINKQELLKTISEKVENLYKQLNEGKGYNPYRDAKGRFASGPSAAFGKYYAFGRAKKIYEDATSSNIDSKVKQYIEAVTAMSMTMSDTITKIDPNGYFAPYEISYQDLDF